MPDDIIQQAKAALPKPELAKPWEDEPTLNLPPTSKLGQAYEHAKQFLSDHEAHLSEKVLKPFREGLDNMASDLEEAGESGHTKTGGQLTGPTRALAAGTGALLRMVPVGADAKSTAQALMVPPDLKEEGLDFSKLEGHALVEAAPETAYRARPVGQKGVAAGERPVATSSLEKAQTYKENLESMTGKPHEVVQFPTKAAEHNKHAGPAEGETWYSLKKAVPEENVKVHGKAEAKKSAPDEKPSPKDVVEKAGLNYKGEVTPGSGVHMFEHPDHPGKTAALNEHQITPENVKEKMDAKIKEFKAGEAAAKKATEKGSAELGPKNIKFKKGEKSAKLPSSDKKTLDPTYLLGHENHFDPNTYTPEQLIQQGILTGKKPVQTT